MVTRICATSYLVKFILETVDIFSLNRVQALQPSSSDSRAIPKKVELKMPTYVISIRDNYLGNGRHFQLDLWTKSTVLTRWLRLLLV